MLALDASELEQLANYKLSLDCPEISLVPSASDSSNPSYVGPGSITQTDKAYFIVKIFCQEGDPIAELSKQRSQAGQLIPGSEYYSLSAFDMKERNWTTKRVLSPDISANLSRGYLIVSCIVRELTFVSDPFKREIKDRVEIWFPGSINIPCNTSTVTEISVQGKRRVRSSNFDISQIETNDFAIEIKEEKNRLHFSAVSGSLPITDSVTTAFLESLQFVLAWPLEWSIMELVQGKTPVTKIRAIVENKHPVRRTPPISFHDPDRTKDVWNLFDKYCTYSLGQQNGAASPIFKQVWPLLYARSSSFSAEVLTLGVSVEGVLKQKPFMSKKSHENKIRPLEKKGLINEVLH